MRQPSPVGAKVDQARKTSWFNRFLHYRHPPTPGAIDAFLRQFGRKNKNVAARLLDSVEVVSRAEMELAFRTLMQNLPGWHRDKNQRAGEWRFVPYSFSSGESGDQMIACFRQAMGLKERYYKELFVHPHKLLDQRLTGNDTVVLVDDFAGSGDQACTSWNNLFRELVGGAGTVYLMVVASTMRAQEAIREQTDLQVMSHYNLLDTDNFFAAECHHFSAEDKEAILALCTRHFPERPRGYGDCGLIFVLQHDCPNNSIPLLHSHKKNKWVPLFPRTNLPT
jgi:hypothetical protein